MAKPNSKLYMLDHSRAKVDLYRRYLSVFLTILHRAQFSRIFLFDLFCGEGVYEDESEGSPLAALKCIKNHYYSNNESCPDMTIWFNDKEMSKIEEGRLKTERVKSLTESIFVPDNVRIEFFSDDYKVIFPKAISMIRDEAHSRALFFIDPWGYKDIRLNQIREMLATGKSEVLLSLPISHMYRFATASIINPSSSREPLRIFLQDLFANSVPNFASLRDFIEQLKQRFRSELQELKVFVDVFLLETDEGNTYGLFFFTKHERGFHKMVESKWKLDPDRGQGHRVERTLAMFNEAEIQQYDEKLLRYVKEQDGRTNREIYIFGLENGFLPKHSMDAIKRWKKRGLETVVTPLDGKEARGYYINGSISRKVMIGVRKPTN